MDVPFVDLGANYRRVQGAVDANIAEVIEETQFIGGKPVDRFEQNFADFIDVNHAIGVASGTDAIFLGLKALGVGPGDEVIAVSHTFVSTVDGVVNNGARPRFVDIDRDSYTMDPGLVESAITADTAAILPVHLYGRPVDMGPILDLAEDYDLAVVEDACQAHGARYRGVPVGGLGDLSCFSFYPSKNLGAFGDAGLVATDNPDLAERVRLLREYGEVEKHDHRLIGYNSRMDALQAAVLDAKLPELDAWNEARRAAADRYGESLADLPVQPPAGSESAKHVYHLYVILVGSEDERDSLREYLEGRGISTGIHYPVPVHQQRSYQDLPWELETLPVTEEVAPRILSLPMYPEITDAQVEAVSNGIESFYQSSR